VDLSNIQITDVSQATSDIIRAKYKTQVIVFVCLAVPAIYACFMFKSLIWLFVWGAVGMFGYAYVKNQVEAAFMQQFGASIGFAFSPKATMDSVQGRFFKIGHSQCITDVLSGTSNSLPLRIFNYRYTIGGGKNSHTYEWTVFETTLSKVMPEITLNSNVDAPPGEIGFSLFDGSTHVELEGDFNKYFSLHVPKGYETEAYQIFTPNVMADLIDKAASLDFEFCGNRLYVYRPNEADTTAEMQALFDLVDFLVQLFARNERGVDSVPTDAQQVGIQQ
jgi:hypothetical protein